MRRGVIRSWMMVFAVLLAAVGCGGKQPEVLDPVDVKPAGPDREVFAALDKARLDHRLPVVIGIEEGPSCFKPVGDLLPAEADPPTREVIKEQSAKVARAVRAWLAGELSTSGISPSLIDKWAIEVLEPVVLEVPVEQVRFADDPSCLSKGGWLPEGQHLATSLLGARKLGFKSQLPLASDVQNALLETLGLENMVIESEALFVYEPALAGDGQPMLTPEGQPLFTSPTGEFITQEQVPPPDKRMMNEWVVSSEAPLWFAYREFPRSGWRREGDKDKCNVILIPEALTPQPPECAEFRDASFTVNIIDGESKPVSVTITTGKDDHKGVMMAWGETARIQVNDRIILWLMPKEVTVGVELFVNSLVLDPMPLADDGGAGADDGYASSEGWKDEAPAVDEPPSKADKSKKAEKAEKPAKKGKASDADMLDDYLRD